MTFRTIGVVAAAVVLGVALVDIVFIERLTPDGVFHFNGVLRTLLLLSVAIATAFAAAKFDWWNEYFGRAWTLFFIEYALLTTSEMLRRWGGTNTVTTRETLVVVANVAGIGAYWLMARSLKAAGLDYYGSKLKKWSVIALAVFIAFLLCQEPIIAASQDLTTAEGWATFFSPLADAITFILVAPLVLTTMALRGGQLSWIFGFLATGTIGWMVNQASRAMVTFFGGGDSEIRTGRIVGFAIAGAFISAAAWTQWLAVRRTVKEPRQ